MLDRLKEIFKNKEDRRFILRFAVILIGVLGAWYFYTNTPDKPYQNTVKAFVSSFGKLDTTKSAATFSPSSDKEAAQMFSEYFNTASVNEFYSALFKNYKFRVGDVNFDKNTCTAELSLPNIKESASAVLPQGLSSYTGNSKEWKDLYKSSGTASLFGLLKQAVAEGKITLKTVVITFQMEKVDDAWKIVFDRNTLNQISGELFGLIGSV